jgi:hypothetical protein
VFVFSGLEDITLFHLFVFKPYIGKTFSAYAKEHNTVLSPNHQSLINYP